MFRILRSKSRSRRGFSLIELLVVVTISAVISSLAIVYSKISQRQIALYVETQKIGEVILRAKALTLATYNDPTPPSCGYGFDIDYTTRTYTLFGYNPMPPPPGCNIATIDPASKFPIVQTEVLNRDIVFDTSAADTLYSVLFTPPEPRIFISNNISGAVTDPPISSSVHLKTLDGSTHADVTVSPAGQVEF